MLKLICDGFRLESRCLKFEILFKNLVIMIQLIISLILDESKKKHKIGVHFEWTFYIKNIIIKPFTKLIRTKMYGL
jgi:hypothetical protein